MCKIIFVLFCYEILLFNSRTNQIGFFRAHIHIRTRATVKFISWLEAEANAKFILIQICKIRMHFFLKHASCCLCYCNLNPQLATADGNFKHSAPIRFESSLAVWEWVSWCRMAELAPTLQAQRNSRFHADCTTADRQNIQIGINLDSETENKFA